MNNDTGLLDARGNRLQSFKAAQATKPHADKEFGTWAGKDAFYATLPGGGILQFDLSRLTLADFRSMRLHYQLGASLNVLTFVMHQIDWKIECENAEITDLLETEIRQHWTPLIFALSQSFWAGYTPIAINYENRDGYTRIKRFKDLVPEECAPHWKVEEGWHEPGKPAPKINTYDGFTQNGNLIPVENTLWYPLLMENGDHWGRKLLKPAFPPWFFSNLIHLYANRYFERFGEPLPVGRADFDSDIDVGGGNTVSGKTAMEGILANIRNRAVTVLPSDRDPDTKEYDFDIKYLESQMRGADFERYLDRLDEEMSLSVFTPVLLFRTADVGSYNLGQAHLAIFQQMLNAITGDIQFYMQNYLVNRLKEINFPGNKQIARWTYRRLGTVDLSVYKEIVVELIRQKQAKLDMQELGALIGINMEEVEQLTADPAPVPAPVDPANPETTNLKPEIKAGKLALSEAAIRAAREMSKGKSNVTLGFKNRFTEALIRDGYTKEASDCLADDLYSKVNGLLEGIGPALEDAEDAKATIDRLIDLQLQSV